MRHTRKLAAALAAVAAVMFVVAVAAQDRQVPATSTSAPAPSKAKSQVSLEDGVTVGRAAVFGNLTVFPIHSVRQKKVGEFTTLAAALEQESAEVREKVGGGEVASVVIENRGRLPIVVLAGTIVKGGKQDRLIGQDFVIGATKTLPIDAFCVEQGRWKGEREGEATGGKFKVVTGLAPISVRGSGQYSQDQSKVWNEVAKVNKAHGKVAATGTLMATQDDAAIAARRQALVAEVNGFVARQPGAKTVGIAFAVDGKMQGARWFMHHDLFAMFKDTLVTAAAGEALIARARARAEDRQLREHRMAATAVAKFVNRLANAKRRELRKTNDQNAVEYQFSDDAAGSKLLFAPPAKSGTPEAPPSALSRDVLSL